MLLPVLFRTVSFFHTPERVVQPTRALSTAILLSSLLAKAIKVKCPDFVGNKAPRPPSPP